MGYSFVDPLVSSNIFHLVKKNRVIQNIFKVRHSSESIRSNNTLPRAPQVLHYPNESSQFLYPPEMQILYAPSSMEGKANSSRYLTPESKEAQQLQVSASCPTSTDDLGFKKRDNQGNPGGKTMPPAQRKESQSRCYKKIEEEKEKHESRRQKRSEITVPEFHTEPLNVDHESEGATTTSIHMKVMDKIPFIKKQIPDSKASLGTQKRKNKLTVNTGPRYGYRGGESSDGSPCSAGAKNVSRKPIFLA